MYNDRHNFFYSGGMGTIYLEILKSLSKNKNLIITCSDKERGVVILNKSDYINKMLFIPSDASKFLNISEPLIN